MLDFIVDHRYVLCFLAEHTCRLLKGVVVWEKCLQHEHMGMKNHLHAQGKNKPLKDCYTEKQSMPLCVIAKTLAFYVIHKKTTLKQLLKDFCLNC